jgi:hypothetical protein
MAVRTPAGEQTSSALHLRTNGSDTAREGLQPTTLKRQTRREARTQSQRSPRETAQPPVERHGGHMLASSRPTAHKLTGPRAARVRRSDRVVLAGRARSLERAQLHARHLPGADLRTRLRSARGRQLLHARPRRGIQQRLRRMDAEGWRAHRRSQPPKRLPRRRSRTAERRRRDQPADLRHAPVPDRTCLAGQRERR